VWLLGVRAELAGVRYSPSCELRAVAPDGSSPRLIADRCGVGGPGGWGGLGPEWSPDGTMIAFYDGDGLQLINPDGTGRADLATEGGPRLRLRGVAAGPVIARELPVAMLLVPLADVRSSQSRRRLWRERAGP